MVARATALSIPRHSYFPQVLLVNKHRPWDKAQRVFYPEPIAQRCASKVANGWQQVVRAQTQDFGLEINPHHHDAADRNFKERYTSNIPTLP